MKEKFSAYELKCAYEICKLVRDNSANVLASGEKSPADEEWLKKSTVFLKAYDRANAYNLAKDGKAGHLGKALILMDGISKALKKIDP